MTSVLRAGFYHLKRFMLHTIIKRIDNRIITDYNAVGGKHEIPGFEYR